MPDPSANPSRPRAWLISASGAMAGTRYPLTDSSTKIGRAPANDIVLDGPDCATVSQSHLEITREGDRFRVRDLESTNGTWLDGERITQAEVAAGKTIRLGTHGPEFTFAVEQRTPVELDRTI